MNNPGKRLPFHPPCITGRNKKNNSILHSLQKNTGKFAGLLILFIGLLVIQPAMADPTSTVTPQRLYADSNEVYVLFSNVNTDMTFQLFLALYGYSGEGKYGYLSGEIQTDNGLGEGYFRTLYVESESFQPYHSFAGYMPGPRYSFSTDREDLEGVSTQILPLMFDGDITSSGEELMVIPIATDTYPPVGYLLIDPRIGFFERFTTIPYSFDRNRPIVTAADVTMEKGEIKTGIITLAPMHDGLLRYNMTVSLDTPGVAIITGAQFPPGVTGDITISDQSVVVDATCSREGSAAEVPLLSVTYRGDGCCATGIVPVVSEMTDKNNWPVDPTIHNGALSVTGYEQPVAAFDGSPREFAAPGDVAFLDRSTGSVTEWLWKFGDGKTSGDQNPYHRYENPGTYTVNLTVSGPAGSDSCEKAGYIKAGTMPLWFYADKTTGKVPLSVQFNATSVTAPDTWSWYFGDGEISGVRNATHTYTKPGEYTVRLTATKGENSNRAIRYKYVTVSA